MYQLSITGKELENIIAKEKKDLYPCIVEDEYIVVDIDFTVVDGSEIKFKAPAHCSQVTTLRVNYSKNGETISQTFGLVDANGNSIDEVDNLFTADVTSKVILDVTGSKAFFQTVNIDTSDFQLKRATINVTPDDDLASILANAQSNTTINLSAGNYPLLLLVGKNSFPDNITIVGGKNVVMEGVSITSGAQASKDMDQTKNSDLVSVTMSQNLTFKNISFSDHFCVRNCEISGLNVQDCEFLSGTSFYIVPNKVKDFHGDDGSVTYSVIPYFAARRARNLVIKRCHFVDTPAVYDSTGKVKEDESSAILIHTVDGATIHKNTIDKSGFSGIRILGSAPSNRYDSQTSGRIAITSNTIKNTGSRSIRISQLDNARVYMIYNKLYNSDLLESEDNGGERIKISDYTSTSRIQTKYYNNVSTYESNSYDDERIGPETGIALAPKQTTIEKSLQTHVNDADSHPIIVSIPRGAQSLGDSYSYDELLAEYNKGRIIQILYNGILYTAASTYEVEGMVFKCNSLSGNDHDNGSTFTLGELFLRTEGTLNYSNPYDNIPSIIYVRDMVEGMISEAEDSIIETIENSVTEKIENSIVEKIMGSLSIYYGEVTNG